MKGRCVMPLPLKKCIDLSASKNRHDPLWVSMREISFPSVSTCMHVRRHAHMHTQWGTYNRAVNHNIKLLTALLHLPCSKCICSVRMLGSACLGRGPHVVRHPASFCACNACMLEACDLCVGGEWSLGRKEGKCAGFRLVILVWLVSCPHNHSKQQRQFRSNYCLPTAVCILLASWV